MTLRGASLANALRTSIARSDAVAAIAIGDTLRRYRVLAVAAVPINLIYAAVFWLRERASEPEKVGAWIHAIALTHTVSAMTMMILALALHYQCRHNQEGHALAKILQAVFCFTALGFAIALSTFDQLVSSSTTNFATISLVIGMTSLIRPRTTLALFTVTYGAFFVIVAGTQTDPELLAMARSQSLGACVFSFIASTVVWYQYVDSELLRRDLRQANRVLAQKQDELAFLATRDSLTGLYVRREFTRLAHMELARATRVSAGTSLIMVDLDHFKQINDRYGHPAGDEVLQQVGAILQNGVRETDIVARMGGEEFVVLLPDTDQQGAIEVAEKIRLTLHRQALHAAGHTLPVTASLGISALAAGQKAGYEALYAAADKALYEAKAAGRNRSNYAPVV